MARLRGIEPVRRLAIAELHERLRREAGFEIRKRARRLPELATRDLDDLAVQAAVARKVLIASWHVLALQQPFNPSRPRGANAPVPASSSCVLAA